MSTRPGLGNGNSLFGRTNSLFLAPKFPVPVSREFAANRLNAPTHSAFRRPELAKFPVKFPVLREFASADRCNRHCFLSQPVESLRRDLHGCTNPRDLRRLDRAVRVSAQGFTESRR